MSVVEEKVSEVINNIIQRCVSRLRGDNEVLVLNMGEMMKILEDEGLLRKVNGREKIEFVKDLIAKIAYILDVKYVIVPEHSKLNSRYTGRVYLSKSLDSDKLINILMTLSTFTTFKVELDSRGRVVLKKHFLTPKFIIEVLYGQDVANAFQGIEKVDVRGEVFKILTAYYRELKYVVDEYVKDLDTAKQFIYGIVKVVKPRYLNELSEGEKKLLNSKVTMITQLIVEKLLEMT